jgi:hypothetical protein
VVEARFNRLNEFIIGITTTGGGMGWGGEKKEERKGEISFARAKSHLETFTEGKLGL